VEFLERMAVDSYGEQWLVRAEGGNTLRNAHVFFEDDELVQIETKTRPWLGFAHPSVTPIHSISRDGRRLVIVTGDERGTPLLRAAQRVTDALERERWAIAEICAIGDGLTAMAAREPGFVHRRASNEHIVVGADGRARLRAPIAEVVIGPRAGFLGRPRHVAGGQWLAPEQVKGLASTPASDVYQLALTLYCALSGAYPFQASGDFEMLKAILERDIPAPPSTILGIAPAIARGMARDASERFATVADFVAELRRRMPDDPSGTRAKLAAEPAHVPPGRSPLVAGDRCPKQWDELTATDVDGIRHCGECQHDVVRVRSIEALVPLLGKRCVALAED
jgi:hypothetical protein